jgi:hypothetical protein
VSLLIVTPLVVLLVIAIMIQRSVRRLDAEVRQLDEDIRNLEQVRAEVTPLLGQPTSRDSQRRPPR